MLAIIIYLNFVFVDGSGIFFFLVLDVSARTKPLSGVPMMLSASTTSGQEENITGNLDEGLDWAETSRTRKKNIPEPSTKQNLNK